MTYFFPLFAVLVWGGNTVVNKLAVGRIAPAEIGFFRWLAVAVLLSPFVLRPLLARRAQIAPLLPKIVVLGLLGMAVYQSLAYYAASLTSATNMGIILALMPLMSLGLASALLGQRLNAGGVLGSLLSLLGVLLVIAHGDLAGLLHQGIGPGDGMMLVATLAYGLYGVLLKKWQIRLPGLQLLYLQVLVAVLAMLPMYLLSPHHGLDAGNLPLVAYAGLLASIAAPLAWMRGVQEMGPNRMALFFNLLPLVTAAIAAVLLDERLGVHHLYGGALTLAGVFLAERWRPAAGLTTNRQGT
ncbi:DMT family transporter [Pseudomonas citronellolis]|uniref:DMT family transporter n=1 Tax=Pseudomonas citronellolis TaxID=53408 RepID=UPI000778B8E4|nr:DMT family transporter [Pseudomonas citronellolis]AMO76472.1 EamA-like transporter family protein [Pseudomonas citronellolis]WRT81809.1 DMT family transporter [Pseudomonas citronellolis]